MNCPTCGDKDGKKHLRTFLLDGDPNKPMSEEMIMCDDCARDMNNYSKEHKTTSKYTEVK